MKNREFKVNGKRYAIVESNASYVVGKWQAKVFDTRYNAWVCTCFYANTQAELKEKVKDYERLCSDYYNGLPF